MLTCQRGQIIKSMRMSGTDDHAPKQVIIKIVENGETCFSPLTISERVLIDE